MRKNNLNYSPESPEEELFELVGRLKAFAAYVNSTKYSIDRKIIALMLGFSLEEEEEKNVECNSTADACKLD